MRIALVGNPNTGKSSLFNHLTGLNQKIGNFPGVTTEKKIGFCKISTQETVEIIDLPGIYSLHAKAIDEEIVVNILTEAANLYHPQKIVFVADAANLKRNLLLLSQLKELEIEIILALNMVDVAQHAGLYIDVQLLEKYLKTPIFPINARTGEGIDGLKESFLPSISYPTSKLFDIKDFLTTKKDLSFSATENLYTSWLYLDKYQSQEIPSNFNQENLKTLHAHCADSYDFLKIQETVERYKQIDTIINEVVVQKAVKRAKWQDHADRILMHPFWGYVVFFLILLGIFQAIFSLASYPMDWIEQGVNAVNAFLQAKLPASAFTNLLTEGVIAGIGGVIIFIPQIAIIFFFIAILEETGYMSRVMFLMDRSMRRFGLSGKSIVPLISGVACAIPAIMATRHIENWKERIITIFVAPFMSCSARIPVYTILIALVIPNKKILYIFNLQGLVLMLLYLLGLIMALLSAWVMKQIFQAKEKSYFVIELPIYKSPRWANVGLTIVDKVKSFVWEAGKIIVAISIILWTLASYGPKNEMILAEKQIRANPQSLSTQEIDTQVAAKKLELSYAGRLGKFIEPVIAPLGFNWKIGIALITSFAAREVFVGTMATIYSIGDENEEQLKQKMQQDINPTTGKSYYTLATGAALMVFYAFAMQCMSTLATVYKETKRWKWVFLQFFYMTGIAYVFSWITYQILNS